MKVLVTGANGFIGKNLVSHLIENKDLEVLQFTRDDDITVLEKLVVQSDFIFHLAGVNRPEDPEEFKKGNRDLTRLICQILRESTKIIPILFSSSIQAEMENDYGQSKLEAEEELIGWAKEYDAPVYIFRLPNVFGKWSRPNYNSVVATFCHNIARDIPININNRDSPITLVYIDDVIDCFEAVFNGSKKSGFYLTVEPQYKTTVGELADQLVQFKNSRKTLISARVGSGFLRALYSTYISYLPVNRFSYQIPKYGDERGVFVEMLKTEGSGQFSFFTAHPGVTRGGHYHHTKTEKFLVIKGHARFCFRHILSGEAYELNTSGEYPEVVETVPGWAHDITNIGEEEMVVMLWANENFNRERPDTVSFPLAKKH